MTYNAMDLTAHVMKWAANDMIWAANVMKCHDMGCKWHEMNEMHAHMHTYDATTMRRRPEMREWRKCNIMETCTRTMREQAKMYMQHMYKHAMRRRRDNEATTSATADHKWRADPPPSLVKCVCDDHATTMRRRCDGDA